MASETTIQIWNGLMEDIQNEYGVAGLMGNLQAESGLIPYRVQGDFTDGYVTSITYTEQVDSGTVSESDFVNTEQGYGLAQWTFSTRKQGLYDMKESMGLSIGSVEVGIAYLLHELKNDFAEVYEVLKNAISVSQASDIVLFDFESPADQSDEVVIERRSLGEAIYNELGTGTTPGGSTDDREDKHKATKKKYNFLILNARRRRSTWIS